MSDAVPSTTASAVFEAFGEGELLAPLLTEDSVERLVNVRRSGKNVDMSDNPHLICSFSVSGPPEPRGSKASRVLYLDPKRKVPVRRQDGSIMSTVYDTNDAASKKWMEQVRQHARVAHRGPPIEGTALDVVLVFFVHRPDSHYGTGKNRRLVKDSAPARPLVRPDFDKLARPVLDALTGLVWKDDSQVVGGSIDKYYAVPLSEADHGEGVRVTVGYAEQQVAADLPFEQRTRWVETGDDEPMPEDSLFAA